MVDELEKARATLVLHISEMECRAATMMSYCHKFGVRNEWARDREKLEELKAEVERLEIERGKL